MFSAKQELTHNFVPTHLCKTIAELIADPDRWTKKVCARTASGLPTTSCDPAADKWCLIGMTFKIADSEVDRVKMLDKLNEAMPLSDTLFLSDYNDQHGHRDVLALAVKAGV